jgi:hypothetical protein
MVFSQPARLALPLSLFILLNRFIYAESLRLPKAYNEIGFDFPFDGGGVVTYSRMWKLTRAIHGGFQVSGGVIERNFDFTAPNLPNLSAHTKALMLPYIGPRIGIYFPIIGVSIGYGAFWARTDLEVKGDSIAVMSGRKSGLGTGFYSPFLVLDFYNQRQDIVFGFGLGGFLGTSYPSLQASSPTASVTTNASPIETLSIHFHVLWADGRKARLRRQENPDEDF